MAQRCATRPHVSVLLSVHDAEDVLVRTVESVLNQDYRSLELIVCDCASTDSTSYMLTRFSDRDIRVRTIELPDASLAGGRDAALAQARGTYALFIDQGDWLSAGYLSAMVEAAEENSAEMVASSLSIDTVREDGSRSSITAAPASQVWETAADFRRGMGALIANNEVANVTGKLLLIQRLRDLALRFGPDEDAFELSLTYLEQVSRACVLQDPCYHMVVEERFCRNEGVLDSGMYERVERRHRRLLELYRSWGLENDAACMESVHRLHLWGVIHCIDDVSVNAGRISSIERRERVQDMIDAPSTRASVAALRASSKDFGFMFAPIARRSAAACCMGARIQDIVSRALAPMAPAHPAFL